MSYEQHKNLPYKKDVIEDSFVRITKKQWDYIQILADSLSLTSASRNAHITSIVGSRWANAWFALSKTEGSQIIDKFKKWNEDKRK